MLWSGSGLSLFVYRGQDEATKGNRGKGWWGKEKWRAEGRRRVDYKGDRRWNVTNECSICFSLMCGNSHIYSLPSNPIRRLIKSFSHWLTVWPTRKSMAHALRHTFWNSIMTFNYLVIINWVWHTKLQKTHIQKHIPMHTYCTDIHTEHISTAGQIVIRGLYFRMNKNMAVLRSSRVVQTGRMKLITDKQRKRQWIKDKWVWPVIEKPKEKHEITSQRP